MFSETTSRNLVSLIDDRGFNSTTYKQYSMFNTKVGVQLCKQNLFKHTDDICICHRQIHVDMGFQRITFMNELGIFISSSSFQPNLN